VRQLRHRLPRPRRRRRVAGLSCRAGRFLSAAKMAPCPNGASMQRRRKVRLATSRSSSGSRPRSRRAPTRWARRPRSTKRAGHCRRRSTSRRPSCRRRPGRRSGPTCTPFGNRGCAAERLAARGPTGDARRGRRRRARHAGAAISWPPRARAGRGVGATRRLRRRPRHQLERGSGRSRSGGRHNREGAGAHPHERSVGSPVSSRTTSWSCGAFHPRPGHSIAYTGRSAKDPACTCGIARCRGRGSETTPDQQT